MTKKFFLLASACAFGMASAAQAASVTFGANLLDDATTVTQDGLTLTATTSPDGWVGTYTGGGNGLYIGGGFGGTPTALSGSYALGFSKSINSISIKYDWLSVNSSGTEEITNFGTDTSGAVSISHSNLLGLDSASFDGVTITPDGRRSDGLITYSGAAFNSFTFDHTQAAATLGFTIREISVNVVPLPAGLPLMMTGLFAFGLMRKRKA